MLDNDNSATGLFFTESQSTQSTWVSTDEGRFIYTQDTEKIYYGDSDEWIEVGTGGAPEAHNILSTSHGDTVTGSSVAGDLIYANATPKWTKLAKGTDGELLALQSGIPDWVGGAGNEGEVLTFESGVPTWSSTAAASSSFLLLSDTPANYTSDAKKVLVVNEAANAVAFASNMLWDETNDRLEISGGVVGAPLYSIRITTGTTGNRSCGSFKHKTSNDMADGFGSSLYFGIEDDMANESIASLGAVRSGADDTGSLVFRTYLTGSSSERVRINEEGLLVGGASDISCGGTHCLILQHGNAPTNWPNNAPVLFSDPRASGSGIYCLNIRNSDGTLLRLQQRNHIADASGGGGNVDIVVNGILDILQANGLMAGP